MRNNHSSIQPWSKGPLFPAVIAVVERYADHGADMNAFMPLASRLLCTSYELTLDGESEEYATREDAEVVARWLIDKPNERLQRRDALRRERTESAILGLGQPLTEGDKRLMADFAS